VPAGGSTACVSSHHSFQVNLVDDLIHDPNQMMLINQFIQTGRHQVRLIHLIWLEHAIAGFRFMPRLTHTFVKREGAVRLLSGQPLVFAANPNLVIS